MYPLEWKQYEIYLLVEDGLITLAEMNKEGTYGDHITLQAASNIFNVQITVHSSLGVVANTVIQDTLQKGKGSIMCA